MFGVGLAALSLLPMNLFLAVRDSAVASLLYAGLATAPLNVQSQMLDGDIALAPMPFVVFCIDYPEECRKTGEAERVHLTDEKWAELIEVNRRTNATIRPRGDATIRRLWKLGVGEGDCNAYAIRKRHELISSGWPSAALSLAVARTSWGQGHLVVVVRTDEDDVVLDSLTNSIVPWRRTSYDWIMRQSAQDPKRWVSITNGLRSERVALANNRRPLGAGRYDGISRRAEMRPSAPAALVYKNGGPSPTGFRSEPERLDGNELRAL